MINLSRDFLNNSHFNSSYVSYIKGKIKSTTLDINHSFFGNFQSIKIDNDFLNFLLIDPFSNFNKIKDDNLREFINVYLCVMNYLLKGKPYFDYLKIKNKYNPKRNEIYKNERLSLINSFNISCLYKINTSAKNNEKDYMLYYNKIKDEFKILNIDISKKILYKYIDQEKRVSILNKINSPICPYCNRQYIDYYKDYEGDEKIIAQLDHFYPKGVFPLFSLTLANFVPSCAYCNSILKRNYLFPLNYPFGYSNNDTKIFLLDDLSYINYYTVDNVKIRLNDKHEFYDQLIFFNVDCIYKNHTPEIINWLNRKKLFSNSYKKSLEQVLKRNISNDELKEILFDFNNKDDLSKISLGKLKKDILDF